MTHSDTRGWLGVAAITSALFVFLTTELMPVGLLTPIASSLNVTIGTTGLMVTLYGVSAGLGVPFLVAWTRRLNRRWLLSALLAVLVIGNIMTSIAPTFALVLLIRLVMGFANGMFWAIGVSMAMRIVPGKKASKAAAVVMSGISIAMVVGIPLGTLLQDITNWRTTFMIWAGLSLIVFVAVSVAVPSLPSANAISVREVFGLPVHNPRLALVLVTVVFFVLGHFGAYTFVRPFLEQTTGASPGFIMMALMVFGIGGAAGNVIAGGTVAKSLRSTFLVGSGLLIACLVTLIAFAQVGWIAMVALGLWGAAFGAVQLSQLTMTQMAAPQTFEAAMSLNTLAYNTSIAIAAFIGGFLVDSWGVRTVAWFGVAMMAAAIAMVSTNRTAGEKALGSAGSARSRG
ncbi:MAG: MFS transporter [Actinomycetales bacterium]|nr:MAG: MFS transporter [Actinomycetales bacterium]